MSSVLDTTNNFVWFQWNHLFCYALVVFTVGITHKILPWSQGPCYTCIKFPLYSEVQTCVGKQITYNFNPKQYIIPEMFRDTGRHYSYSHRQLKTKTALTVNPLITTTVLTPLTLCTALIIALFLLKCILIISFWTQLHGMVFAKLGRS